MRTKILASLAGSIIMAFMGWVSKSIVQSSSDMRVASINITNCSDSLEKLTSRYEKMDERYNELQITLSELKVRLEITKLESMEASLTLKETLESLEKKSSVIPYTGKSKIEVFPEIKSTPAGLFEGLNDKVLEQRKLVETLERPSN